MKKSTKFISVILAVMLAACSFAVMPFATNAAETEKLSASDTATDDAATKNAVVDHVELTKLPDKTNYIQGYDDYLQLDGLEFNVNYVDGRIEHIICENGEYLDNIDAHFYTSDGEEVEYFEDLPLGKNTVKLAYNTVNNDIFNSIEFAEYEINKVAFDHIELTKLPDKTEYIKGIGTEDFSLEGLEYNVCYNDGTTEHIIYDDAYEYSSYISIYGEYYTADGEEETNFDDLPLGKNTVKLVYEVYDPDSDIEYVEFAEYEINIVQDPNVAGIKSIEMIQLPDKVFTTECLVNGEPDNYGNKYYEQYYKNSLWANMNGAKLKITFTDGTTDVYDFFTEDGYYPVYVYEGIFVTVTDLGGYKAEVKLAGHTTVFEAKHTGSDNNDNNTTPTNPTDTPNGNNTTPTNPTDTPNGDLSKPTSSQVSSPDTVTNGSSGTTVTGNGTVATGSTVYSLAAIIILVCACGVMVFLNRKKYFKR